MTAGISPFLIYKNNHKHCQQFEHEARHHKNCSDFSIMVLDKTGFFITELFVFNNHYRYTLQSFIFMYKYYTISQTPLSGYIFTPQNRHWHITLYCPGISPLVEKHHAVVKGLNLITLLWCHKDILRFVVYKFQKTVTVALKQKTKLSRMLPGIMWNILTYVLEPAG